MNLIRRTGTLAVVLMASIALAATAASAATVGEVVDDASTTGFYLDRGVSISEDDATQIVSAARNNGSRFYLVVLDDTPPGGNTTFAEAVYDDLGINAGTVLALSPDDVGFFTEDEGFTAADLDAAFEFANSEGGNDAEFAANFVIGLFADAPVTVPTTAATATPAGDDTSGGGSGLLILLVIVVGGGLLLFLLMRRGQKQSVNAAAEQMAKARGVVQKQVDAVANDILDLEDEVRLASNDDVDEFYNAASKTYQTITERLQQADTPAALVDLSNDLDVAIWQLDCAEALLDDKPKPPRPERKELEPAPSADDRVTIPAPRDDYQRRPGRRSSYMGTGLMEILIGVAGQVLASGGRGRRGGLGGMMSRRPAQRRSGGVVPGPGSLVLRSKRRTSRPSGSRRTRRGGGRVRGGGKRRRG
ncbi:MAG: hypothetical protein QNJ75_09465 [Acidimicrobiia bacterium]|nr:hypothetical protein [Acidimicrobiia bacterium]